MNKYIDINKLCAVCKKAIDTFGATKQLQLTQEECGELIVAISHLLRERPGSPDEFVEELADIHICLAQLNIMLTTMDLEYKFMDKVNEKIARLEEKLNAKR